MTNERPQAKLLVVSFGSLPHAILPSIARGVLLYRCISGSDPSQKRNVGSNVGVGDHLTPAARGGGHKVGHEIRTPKNKKRRDVNFGSAEFVEYLAALWFTFYIL